MKNDFVRVSGVVALFNYFIITSDPAEQYHKVKEHLHLFFQTDSINLLHDMD